MLVCWLFVEGGRFYDALKLFDSRDCWRISSLRLALLRRGFDVIVDERTCC